MCIKCYKSCEVMQKFVPFCTSLHFVMFLILWKGVSKIVFSRQTVLHEKTQIDDGIGLPDWKLTLYLFASWVCVFLVAVKGVKSSGKASYFLALFPYVVLIAILIRAVTLPGSVDGILFFIEPKWGELLNPNVRRTLINQLGIYHP